MKKIFKNFYISFKDEKNHKKKYFISNNILSAKITQILQNKTQYSKSYYNTLSFYIFIAIQKNYSKPLIFLTKLEKSMKNIFFISINVLSAKTTQILQNITQNSKKLFTLYYLSIICGDMKKYSKTLSFSYQDEKNIFFFILYLSMYYLQK